VTKTIGPAVTEEQLGQVNMVLVSHDNHPDILDDRGRAFALATRLVLTTTWRPRHYADVASTGCPEIVRGARWGASAG
jgi:hypothetical protein